MMKCARVVRDARWCSSLGQDLAGRATGRIGSAHRLWTRRVRVDTRQSSPPHYLSGSEKQVAEELRVQIKAGRIHANSIYRKLLVK